MPALDREQVARAVKALLQHERAPKPGEKRKAQLFEDTDHKVLSLVVGMKEQPRKETGSSCGQMPGPWSPAHRPAPKAMLE